MILSPIIQCDHEVPIIKDVLISRYFSKCTSSKTVVIVCVCVCVCVILQERMDSLPSLLTSYSETQEPEVKTKKKRQ